MDDNTYFLRYGFGEHKKRKNNDTGSYGESGINKSIALSWKYYDQSKPVMIKDANGNIVGTVEW